MKSFMVFDEYSDYKEKTDYKGLKELLVEELKRDTLENGEEDFNIVENNFKVMIKLALEDYTDLNYLKEQLLSFGWYIQDLGQLQQDLSNFQAKMNYNTSSQEYNYIEETLKLIDKEMK